MALWNRNKMKLKKRDCGINMRLVPYGAGWTDVYLDIEGDHLHFVISDVLGNQFDDLLRVLYHFHPKNGDPENADDIIECKCGICAKTDTGFEVVKIVDELRDEEHPWGYIDIPWKADFTWDEEGAHSKWTLERTPDESKDFMLKIHIEQHRAETTTYDYEVRYKDFCYAVAKACTETLKEYGFFGYHHSTYTQDMNIRYLLFLKSVALDNFEARNLTYYEEKGHGETTVLNKELELLLFDM